MELQRITLNGKEYEIREVAQGKLLGECELGKAVDIGGMVFRPLEHEDGKTLCLLQDLYKDGEVFEFGDSPDWNDSPIRKTLNGEFAQQLIDTVGYEHVHTMDIDLTAPDGTKPYHDCTDPVALLDSRQYAQYREYIDDKPDAWQWLVNPWSKAYSRNVCGVGGGGALGYGGCGNGNSVRPLCLLSSSIFVSDVEN